MQMYAVNRAVYTRLSHYCHVYSMSVGVYCMQMYAVNRAVYTRLSHYCHVYSMCVHHTYQQFLSS